MQRVFAIVAFKSNPECAVYKVTWFQWIKAMFLLQMTPFFMTLVYKMLHWLHVEAFSLVVWLGWISIQPKIFWFLQSWKIYQQWKWPKWDLQYTQNKLHQNQTWDKILRIFHCKTSMNITVGKSKVTWICTLFIQAPLWNETFWTSSECKLSFCFKKNLPCSFPQLLSSILVWFYPLLLVFSIYIHLCTGRKKTQFGYFNGCVWFSDRPGNTC